VKAQDVAQIALLGAVAWLLLTLMKKMGGGIEAARGATTNLIERFFPLIGPEQLKTYAILFPDGKLHAVNGEDIDSRGNFSWQGQRYQIAGKATAGNYIAKRLVS